MPSRTSVLSILFDIGRDTESRIYAAETLIITQEQEQNSNYFFVMFIDPISVRTFTSVLLLSPLRERNDD